ncbi:MAG: hypothetical protein R3B13_32945 [Polyangiaceae bacterium]
MTRERRAESVLLLVLIAALVWVFARPAVREEPVRLSALGAVPRDAMLVLTLDADALRKSTWGRDLLAHGQNLRGLGSLDTLCHDSPLERLRELALFVPTVPADEALDVGVVAQGEFDAEVTLACIERVVNARGGSPIRSPLGSFTSIRDRGASRGEIAMRQGGPLILGEGRTLRLAVDTAEGRSESVRSNEAHSGLRVEVGPHALIVSLLLPPGWLTRVTGLEVARASPLAQVRAAAVGIDLEPVKVDVVLGCESDALAREVARILEGFSKDAGGLIELELGRNPLERAKISARGRVVRLQLDLDTKDLDTLSRRLLGQLPAAAPGDAPIGVDDAGRSRVDEPSLAATDAQPPTGDAGD